MQIKQPECSCGFITCNNIVLGVTIAKHVCGQLIVCAFSNSDSGVNQNLVYAIQTVNANPGAGPFQINSTGSISTALVLDYETNVLHDLVVKVVDQGSSPRSTTVKVTVDVTDINEYAPTFTGMVASMNLPEATAVGYAVATIVATDLDTSSVIAYQFDASNTSFLIDAASGDIKVEHHRELTQNHQLYT